MAVRSDADLVSLDERRRGRLELDLFALDSVRGQLPADAEKASRRLHADLFRLDRGDLRRALEVDVDFLGLQPAIDANGSAHSKFLGADAALDTQRAARRNLLRGNGAVHLKGAARLDLLGFQVPRDTRRSGRPEFLHVHVGIEDAGSGDPGGLRFQWTLDPRAPRGLELRRLDRVPGHDAAAKNLDRLLAQLRSEPREVHGAHRLADRVSGVLCMARRLRGRLRHDGSDRFPEIRRRGLGCFRLLRLFRFRVVAGLDLQVRLLVDLAAREPFLELPEDVLPLHWLHRKVEATAKYISFRARASSGVFAIQVSVSSRVRGDFAASSRRWGRSSVFRNRAFLCPNIPSRWGAAYLCKPRG